MPDPYIFISFLALGLSTLGFVSRMIDKNLSIREHDAYREAVARDLHRIETRLQHIEQNRPTTGELQIVVNSFNKRLDEIKDGISRSRGSG